MTSSKRCRKKRSVFDDVLDVSKISVGVGVGSTVALNLTEALPGQAKTVMQKPIQSAVGVLGAVPLMAAGKTVLKALKEWEDIEL